MAHENFDDYLPDKHIIAAFVTAKTLEYNHIYRDRKKVKL
jgi:hypothetical protein